MPTLATTVRSILVPLGAVILVPLAASAGPSSINCASRTISSALRNLRPGDTLLVTGACHENVVIDAGIHDVTIDGQDTTSVIPAVATQPAITVFGQNVTLRRLVVNGGDHVVQIARGGSAVIERSTIKNAAKNGVFVLDSAFAAIGNSTIEDNGGHGVSVAFASSAVIGLLSRGATVTSPNTIQNNTNVGIIVSNAATASIVANTISGNGFGGIRVQQVSHGRISGNAIDNNVRSGIAVLEYSGVTLAEDEPGGVFDPTNTTTTEN